MTREWFVENINEWTELKDFCNDYGCSYCDNIYDSYDRDSYIDEMLTDLASDAGSWQDLRDTLRDIPCGGDYYIRDTYGEWLDADYLFDDYKNDVIEWADSAEVWEEDDDDNEPKTEAPWYAEIDDFVPPDEPMSLSSLMHDCNDMFFKVSDTTVKEDISDEQDFRTFIAYDFRF